MRTIKIMPDYGCYPLWESSPGQFGNINPNDLPISDNLKERLQSWADAFDSTLRHDNPALSGFQSDEEHDEFRKEGRNIEKMLIDELGQDYSVVSRF